MVRTANLLCMAGREPTLDKIHILRKDFRFLGFFY
jgi:hypothetical protein